MVEEEEQSVSIDGLQQDGSKILPSEPVVVPFANIPVPLDNTPSLSEPTVTTSGNSVKHVVMSVGLIVFATLSGVADSQLSKQVYVDPDVFNAPFLMMYTNQMTRLFTFPLLLIATSGAARIRGKPFNIRTKIRGALQLWGPKGPTVLALAKTVGVLGLVTIAGLGLALSTLHHLSASATTTLFTSQVAMIYIISAIFLKQKVLIFKIAATALSFVGVGLIAYAVGFQSDSDAIIGVVLALVSSLLYSGDQVYMRYVLKRPDLAQVCLYMSATAIFILLIGWTLPLAMKLTAIESWTFSTAPWGYIFGSGGSALVFALLMNYGITFTSPFFMSMIYLIRIPVNNLIDAYLRKEVFSNWEIAGAVCIGVGFILIVIPDDRVSVRLRDRLGWLLGRKSEKAIVKHPLNA